jgi:hypothetical protein
MRVRRHHDMTLHFRQATGQNARPARARLWLTAAGDDVLSIFTLRPSRHQTIAADVRRRTTRNVQGIRLPTWRL